MNEGDTLNEDDTESMIIANEDHNLVKGQI